MLVGTDFSAYSMNTFQLIHEAGCFAEDGYDKSKTMLAEIKEQIKKDAGVASFTCDISQLPENKPISSKMHKPYDHNLLGQDLVPPRFINGNRVETENGVYFLAGCPKSYEAAGWYWEEIIKNGVKVVVSLHDETEGGDRANKFWTQEQLDKMAFPEGIEIKVLSSRVLDERPQVEVTSKNGKTKTVDAKIVETILEITNGEKKEEKRHLHYAGWPDRCSIPSEDLFKTLVDRIEAFSPDKESPIAINCLGGVGRTGSTAITIDERRKIRKWLAQGDSLEALTTNLAEAIFNFRRQRTHVLGNETQVPQVLLSLGKFAVAEKERLVMVEAK